jgi:L-serine dehydratase
MESPSILNDVLGPVMRGPSSSHTAGSYRIGWTLRDLLGHQPARAVFTFDPAGSYARTYRQQGVDLALAAGLMGWPITDRRFRRATAEARRRGLTMQFRISPIPGADHPNAVEVQLKARNGRRLRAIAKSTGGGGFLITKLDGWPVCIDGKAFQVLVEAEKDSLPALRKALTAKPSRLSKPDWETNKDSVLLSLRLADPPPRRWLGYLAALDGVRTVRSSSPVYFVQKGHPLFESAAEMVRLAHRRKWSLGRVALVYESSLLALPPKTVEAEMLRLYAIMEAAVEAGLNRRGVRMQLLRPTADKVWLAERNGRLPTGGLHTRAAARALAALHVSNSMGVVCAAPTGGSAGVIPGVIVTLAKEKKLPPKMLIRSLLAAGVIGLILAKRATFAAEVAGCQVEIGAAGAMAAAAVVEAAGGTAAQAADAAAISFQNTMGSVCDLVQGMCEIPCHTRNAVAASSAFVCADLVMGGYQNPVPLDETVDAVFESGKMLPPELRCTARGGLAMAPSARRLPRLK